MLTIAQQAGDDGRLFGSVTTQDIAEAIRDARGITVDRRKVHLEEPIRHVGTYMVVVEVAARRHRDDQDDASPSAEPRDGPVTRRAQLRHETTRCVAGTPGVADPARC